MWVWVTFVLLFTVETQLKPDDLGDLKVMIQPVAAYWVALADQLKMNTFVDAIRDTSGNNAPAKCLIRDLLHRWLYIRNIRVLQRSAVL